MKTDKDTIDRALYELEPLLRLSEDIIRIFPKHKNSSAINDEHKIEIEEAVAQFGSGYTVNYLEEAPKDCNCFEHLISERILSVSAGKRYTHTELHSSECEVDDQCFVNVYDSGERGKETVALVIPVGMPVMLVEKWIVKLSGKYRVVTWEGRGMFGNCIDFDKIKTSLNSQAADLEKVLDHLGIDKVHVMGLCGGAAIALSAVAMSSDRVLSLSLWHGDFELGKNSLKTTHQQDLQEMLSKVGSSRAKAASMHVLFSRPSVLGNIRRNIGHYILYPYVSPEMLYRYGKLNGEVMTTDLSPYLNLVSAPSLTVTSKDDETAHPSGSLFTAEKLKNSEKYITDSGDHISLFDAPDHLVSRVIYFLSKVRAKTRSDK